MDRLPPKDQLIMGAHSLQEMLKHAPQRILKVYTVPLHGSKQRKQELILECEKKKVPIHYCSLDLLTKMAGSDSHQSLVAHIQGRHFYDVREFLEEHEDKESLFVLMLDQIFDPQNFGALLRSAECFGIDGVVWSKNRGCDLTPTVAKASCGASELLPLLRVSNLATALEQFKEADFDIVAALADPGAESLVDFRYASRTVLIVGSEGEGIQPLLRKKADRLLFIPLKGKVESLNVAQATAVLLSWNLKD